MIPRRDRGLARRAAADVTSRAGARPAWPHGADVDRWTPHTGQWSWWPLYVMFRAAWSVLWPWVVIAAVWWLISDRVAVGVAVVLLGLRWLTKPRSSSTSRSLARVERSPRRRT